MFTEHGKILERSCREAWAREVGKDNMLVKRPPDHPKGLGLQKGKPVCNMASSVGSHNGAHTHDLPG